MTAPEDTLHFAIYRDNERAESLQPRLRSSQIAAWRCALRLAEDAPVVEVFAVTPRGERRLVTLS